MRPSLALFLLLPLVAPAALAGADGREAGSAGACGDAVATRVQARYDGVDDLTARFRQESRHAALGPGGGGETAAEGLVVFAKPGRMRWEYEKPQESLVVSDGQTLWLVDPTAREVQVFEVGEAFLSATAMQFLLGDGDLLTSFDVSAQDGCGEEQVRLTLQPKDDASYERLELLVDRATGDVRATAILDLFGNRTDVAFEDVRTNQAPEAGRFRFEAPEGWRVLELAP
jgi:outer membrane lipoprotein carrier protein